MLLYRIKIEARHANSHRQNRVAALPAKGADAEDVRLLRSSHGLGAGRILLRLSQLLCAESYHITTFTFLNVVFMVAVPDGFFVYKPGKDKIKMEKKRVFKGVATALITPLTEDGVDYLSFGRLIDWQIESGIDALVVCGTTGEASTLTDGEHRELISFAAKRAAGRVPVIAGTGSNDTSYAKELTLHANQAGADAVLAVTPYYNKCTQKGLVNLYTELADISKVPLIPYNVPTRTGINIEPKTYAALAEHPNITGFKEASGNISKIVETMSYVNGRLFMYSGNDDQIVPLLSLGGSGVISVISNLIPKETKAICEKFFEGDISGAANLQFKYHSLIDALFSEVNPIPIKAAMSRVGFCEDYLRLPLTPMEDQNREKLFAIMKEHEII